MKMISYLPQKWMLLTGQIQIRLTGHISHPKPKSGLNSQFQGLKNKIYMVL